MTRRSKATAPDEMKMPVSVTGEQATDFISVAKENKSCDSCGHSWTEYAQIPITKDHLLMLQEGVLNPNILLAAHELADPKKATALIEVASKRMQLTDPKTGVGRELTALETAKHLREARLKGLDSLKGQDQG